MSLVVEVFRRRAEMKFEEAFSKIRDGKHEMFRPSRPYYRYRFHNRRMVWFKRGFGTSSFTLHGSDINAADWKVEEIKK